MENKHGGDIYSYEGILDFSANINPLGLPEQVLSRVKGSLTWISNYPDVQCRILRRRLSEILGCRPEQLFIGNGAADIIFTLALASRPKRALLTAPGFAEYEEALRICDTEIVFFDLKEEAGFRLTEQYLDALTSELDIAFLCTPDNPTGQLIDTVLLQKIVEKCERLDIRLVVDECFLDFAEGARQKSLLGEVQAHRNLFILKSFTKMYALAGMRLGYGICSDTKFLEKMAKCRQPWSVSIPAQEAGIAVLEELVLGTGDDCDYAAGVRQVITEERTYLCEGLERLGITYWKPAANYIFFRTIPELKEKMIGQGILIRDCSNYRNLESGYYRIAVRLREDNSRLLRALKTVLEAEKKGENDAAHM